MSVSVSNTIALIKQRMTEFKNELARAINLPIDRSPHADVADKLSGQTPDLVIQTLRNEVAKHTNKVGVGVHKVNVERMGTYTAQQFDQKLDMLMDLSSGVPVSFYGDREYLPPGITGSFESGSSATPYGNMGMIMEDNGTLVLLRSGTDGDSAGLYYSYLRNADAEPDVTNNLVVTNTRYSPAFFPADRQGYCILNSTQTAIIGRMVNKSDGKFNGIFLSLTNNTFDQTKHTGIVFPEGVLGNITTEGTSTINMPVAFVAGQWVYVLTQTMQNTNFNVGFKVFRVPLANVVSGTYVAPEAVTNWTINRGVEGVVTKTDMTFFDDNSQIFNFTGDVKADSRRGLSNGNGVFTVNVTEQNEVLLTYGPYVQIFGSDSKVQELGFYPVFHLKLDLVNKAVDLSPYYNKKLQVRYDSTQYYFFNCPAMPQQIDNVGLGRPGYYDTWAGQLGGQANNCLYATKYNQLWSFSTTTYFTQRTLYRTKYPVGALFSDVLSMRTAPTDVAGWQFTGRFGSPLSQSFRSHSNIGDNVVLVRNANVRQNAIGDYSVRCMLEGDGTYQYNSISGLYGFKGYNPTINRSYLLDINPDAAIFGVLSLNEGDAAMPTFYGQARFSRAAPAQRFQRIDADMNTSGTVNCPLSVLNTLRTQVLADVISRGYTMYAASDFPLDVELMVPQAYGDMPPFVVAQFIRSDRSAWQVIYAVSITGTRQNVTDATLIPGSFAIIQEGAIGGGGGSIGSGIRITVTDQIGQTCIRRVAGGFTLGIASAILYTGFGDTECSLTGCNYNTSTGRFSYTGSLWNYYVAAPAGWMNFPSRGLYMTLVSEYLRGVVDAGTKMLATVAATNNFMTASPNDQLLTNLYRPQTSMVLISQKIVSAWTIYFSDVTPAMLDGEYRLVDTLTYNLTPGTDANKTFHIWLVKRANVFSYQIVANDTTTPAADSALYLGYAVTTVEGIQRIVAEKRVAVGGMVLARASQGSAIPLTSGTPNNPGKLNWN